MTWCSAWDCKPFVSLILCLVYSWLCLMALLHTRIVDFYDHLSGTYVRETTHTFFSRSGCSGLGLGLHCIMARSKFMTRGCEATGSSVWFRAWKASIESMDFGCHSRPAGVDSQVVLGSVMFEIPDDISGIHWPFYDERNKSVWGFSFIGNLFFFFPPSMSSNIYYH